MQDSIRQVFDRFKKTGNYLTQVEVTRLHEHLKDSTFAEAALLKKRKRIKKREAITCYIIAEMLSMYALINLKAAEVFTDIANQKYYNIVGGIFDFDMVQLMSLPMANGKLLDNELLSHARFRAKQLTDYYIMQINYGVVPDSDDDPILDLIKAEMSSMLKATEKGYKGLYDELMTNIVGYTTLKALEDRGVERVQFIAIIDERTTTRCRELNGKQFDVNELVLGFNVPPITIGSVPHPCRSALMPIESLEKK